jgi:hypothetical protein
MNFYTPTKKTNEPIILNYNEKNDFTLQSANFKIRNNEVIFYLSGMITTSNINNGIPKILGKKQNFTSIIKQNLESPDSRKYLYFEFHDYSPYLINTDITIDPQQNSIDYIYCTGSLNYVNFSRNSFFREEIILRKNRNFMKIIWNKLQTNKIMGLSTDNDVELIDLEKIKEKFAFTLRETEKIKDIVHIERGNLSDSLLISGRENLCLYDLRR